MQISAQQVQHVLEKTSRVDTATLPAQPVSSVEELAEKYGIPCVEVERYITAVEAADDPFREQRITDLARRVKEGAYDVAPEQVVDMAERRAIADRSRLL
jgi:hypothetical protein